jgi:hypothetical protein
MKTKKKKNYYKLYNYTLNGQRNDLLVPRVLSKLVIRKFNF